MASLGDRAKETRNELGLSQKEVARRVGFSQATLSDLENNNSFSTKEVARLAAVLGVSPIWLTEGKGEKRACGNIFVFEEKIPENILRLAEKLLLLPDEKLRALSVLVGVKF